MPLSQIFTNPIGFLENNILISQGGMAADPNARQEQSGKFSARVRVKPAAGIRMASNTPCDQYLIERADSYNTDLEGLDVYFCYYAPDETHMMVVDDQADLMLTPTMNGCSFGVGSPASNGARLVGHANVSRNANTQQGAALQASSQDRLLRSAMNDVLLMSPDQYAPFGSGASGTTIGVRNAGSGRWSFYTQTWRRAGTIYSLQVPAVVQFA